jgi:hypothetical protein
MMEMDFPTHQGMIKRRTHPDASVDALRDMAPLETVTAGGSDRVVPYGPVQSHGIVFNPQTRERRRPAIPYAKVRHVKIDMQGSIVSMHEQIEEAVVTLLQDVDRSMNSDLSRNGIRIVAIRHHDQAVSIYAEVKDEAYSRLRKHGRHTFGQIIEQEPMVWPKETFVGAERAATIQSEAWVWIDNQREIRLMELNAGKRSPLLTRKRMVWFSVVAIAADILLLHSGYMMLVIVIAWFLRDMLTKTLPAQIAYSRSVRRTKALERSAAHKALPSSPRDCWSEAVDIAGEHAPDAMPALEEARTRFRRVDEATSGGSDLQALESVVAMGNAAKALVLAHAAPHALAIGDEREALARDLAASLVAIGVEAEEVRTGMLARAKAGFETQRRYQSDRREARAEDYSLTSIG